MPAALYDSLALDVTGDASPTGALILSQFPLSSQYHPEWVMAGVSGGANSLWLTEWLSSSLDLRPGMRVLNLATSVPSEYIRKPLLRDADE